MNDEQLEQEIEKLIQSDYLEARAEARVPPPEVVWLQAQMRAREESTCKALLPLIIGQALGLAALTGLLVAMIGHLSMSLAFLLSPGR